MTQQSVSRQSPAGPLVQTAAAPPKQPAAPPPADSPDNPQPADGTSDGKPTLPDPPVYPATLEQWQAYFRTTFDAERPVPLYDGVAAYLRMRRWTLGAVRRKATDAEVFMHAELAHAKMLEDHDRQVALELEAEIEEAIARLRFLANLGIQPVFSVCNSKSGSKSTCITYVLAVFAEMTNKAVVLFPTSQNSSTGTASSVSGIEGDKRITVSEYLENVDGFNYFDEFSQYLPTHPTGFSVIFEDPEGVIDDEHPASQVEAQKAVLHEKAVRKTRGFANIIGLDHGNDDITSGSLVVRSARLSDVMVFCALTTAPVSRLNMGKTFRTFLTDRRLPPGPEDEAERTLTGEKVSTADKVLKSIVVLNGVREGIDRADEEMFAELTDAGQTSADDEHPSTWKGTALIVPHDPYIAREDYPPVDLDAIQRATLLAYIKGAVAILETAAPIQGIAIPDSQAPRGRRSSAREGAAS